MNQVVSEPSSEEEPVEYQYDADEETEPAGERITIRCC